MDVDGIPISEARENLAELANRVAMRGDRVKVERRGKTLFALVSPEDLELLELLEDRSDLEIIRQRLREKTIPFEKLRKQLGL